ncbi:MAG: protein kinase [Planctomycetes bacterium]|nr:protein kinase [Planctomycetota bacterium]
MKNCPACQAAVDESSLAAGRCAYCGAVLRNVPQRSVQDIRQDDQETLQDPDATPTMEFAIDAPQETPTMDFGGEKTLDFSGDELASDELTSDPEADVSESMVTAQWLDNVAESQSDPKATIRQKETVSGTFVSKSSLIVKSRHFRSQEEMEQPIASPDDAPDYELLKVLGEGGMGVVYAARQSAIARTVAVKMLKQSNGQTNEQREKFISEAVVTGELDHPNIVPIYDLGANDSGALFYSMKRVKGTPWNEVVKEKSLDANLHILLRVADAVAFAHANGAS